VRSRAIGAFFLGGWAWVLLAHTVAAATPPLPPNAAAVAPVRAQSDSARAAADSTRMLAAPVRPDSMTGQAAPPAVAGRDTAGAGPRRPAWQRQKSPRTAMFASFAIPGLGQLYNERPFWAAVAAGVEFYFLGSWVVEQRLTNRYRALYNADPSDQDAQVLYELHRDSRIQAQWLLAVTIAISGLQSYVDAALADFDESPLPLRLSPEIGAGRTGLSVQLRF